MNPEDETSPPPFDPEVDIPVLDPTGFDLGSGFTIIGGINPTAVIVAVAVLLTVIALAFGARAIYSRSGITRSKKLLIPVAAGVGLVLASVVAVSFPSQATVNSVPDGFSEWASETYDVDISDDGAAELTAGKSIAVERDGIRYIVEAGTDSSGLTYLFNGSGTEFMRAGMLTGGSPAIDPGPVTPKDSELVPEPSTSDEAPQG